MSSSPIPNQIISNWLGFPLSLAYLFLWLFPTQALSERRCDHKRQLWAHWWKSFSRRRKLQGHTTLIPILQSGSQMSRVEKFFFRGGMGGGVGAKAVSYHNWSSAESQIFNSARKMSALFLFLSSGLSLSHALINPMPTCSWQVFIFLNWHNCVIEISHAVTVELIVITATWHCRTEVKLRWNAVCVCLLSKITLIIIFPFLVL